MNNRLLSFYQLQDLPILRILTDRGTEYCGKIELLNYELYLAANDIDTQRRKLHHHKVMESVNTFIRQFYKSFIKSLSERDFMVRWRGYK